jgi:hypothetical protein
MSIDPRLSADFFRAEVTTLDEWTRLWVEMEPRREIERTVASGHDGSERFLVPGFCDVCGKESQFDRKWNDSFRALREYPYDENLACENCTLTSRQRLVLRMLNETVPTLPRAGAAIYVAEQRTVLYRTVQERLASLPRAARVSPVSEGEAPSLL